MYKNILVLKFSDECAIIEAQSRSRHQKLFRSFNKMFPHLETKWHFGAKSAVFECRNFLYAYFLSSISRFSAGVRFSRPADSVNKAGLIFYF